MDTAVVEASSGTDAAVGGEVKITVKTQPPQTFTRRWAGMTVEEGLEKASVDTAIPCWYSPVYLLRGGKKENVGPYSDVELEVRDRLIVEAC